jgi:hypothetical protein
VTVSLFLLLKLCFLWYKRQNSTGVSFSCATEVQAFYKYPSKKSADKASCLVLYASDRSLEIKFKPFHIRKNETQKEKNHNSLLPCVK